MKNIYISVAPQANINGSFNTHELFHILNRNGDKINLNVNSHDADIIIQFGIDNDVIQSPNPMAFHWYFPLKTNVEKGSDVVMSKFTRRNNYKIIPVHDYADFKQNLENLGTEILNGLRVVMTELSAQMLTDTSLTDSSMDYLGYDDFADALYAIVDHPKTCTPLTLAVDAPWGSGKTSLGHLIQNKLKSKPASTGSFPHITCWFDAWMHDDALNLSTSFTSHVAYSAHKQRSWWRRMINPIPVNLVPASEQKQQRLLWFLKFSFASFLISTTIFTLINHNWLSKELILETLAELKIPTPDGLNTFLGTTSIFGFSYALQFVFKYLLTGAKSINSYVNHPDLEAKGGQITKVRDELSTLIKQATPSGSKFIVFVDDLERCRGNGPIDLLEKINQLFNIPNAIVVLLTDLEIIAKKAEERYSLEAVNSKCSFGDKYIQKIIQLQFDLPVSHNISKIESMVSKKIQDRQNGDIKPKKWLEHFYLFKEQIYKPYRNIFNTINPLIIAYRLYSLPLFFIHYLVDKTIYRHWKTGQLSPRIQGKIAVELANVLYLFSIPILLTFINLEFINVHDAWHILLGIFILNGLAFSINKIMCFTGLSLAINLERGNIKTPRKPFFKTIAGLSNLKLPKLPLRMKGLMAKENLYQALEKDTRYFIDARKEAFEMLQFLHLLNPRNVKRITNRIRLILYVSRSRETLAQLDIKLVAKWAVIQECWPELGKQIRINKAFLKQLETNQHTYGDIRSPQTFYITQHIPNYTDEVNRIQSIIDYNSIDKKLSDQIGLLTQFE